MHKFLKRSLERKKNTKTLHLNLRYKKLHFNRIYLVRIGPHTKLKQKLDHNKTKGKKSILLIKHTYSYECIKSESRMFEKRGKLRKK